MLNSNKYTKYTTKLALGLGLLSSLTSLQADQYHYNDILIGDRAAGMGGAYAAIADDPSGLYYNPAGVVYATEVKASGSVNGYNSRSTSYSNVNAGEYEWTRNSSTMPVNFFGIFQPLKDGVAGFSIVVPNSVLEDQDETFKNFKAADTSYTVTNQVLNYNNVDNTMLMGPSYAQAINKNLSVGISLYLYSRHKETTLNQFTRVKKGASIGTEWLYKKSQTNETGFMPKLGIMWSPMEKYSFGLTVSKTIIFSQSPESQSTGWTNITATKNGTTTTFATSANVTASDGSSVNDTANIPGMKTTADNDLPLETTLAMAYFASDDLLYSGDFTYYNSTDIYNSTWNLAVGSEYFINNKWGIRGGVYTNNANTPDNIGKGSNYKGEHIDLIGISSSITKYNKSSSVTFGFNYMGGKGEGRLNANSNRVQDIEIKDISLFVSTSSSF
jgi:long-chain fatty acid transport protein